MEANGWLIHSTPVFLSDTITYTGSPYVGCVNDVASSDSMITAFDTDFPRYGISFLINLLPSSFLPSASFYFDCEVNFH